MELIIVGVSLCFGGILLFMGEYAMATGRVPSWENAYEPENQALYRQSILASILGCLFILFGIGGIATGAYPIVPSGNRLILLALFLYPVNIQARLVVFGVKNYPLAKEKNNGISAMKKAFSIGIFPVGHGFLSVFIATTQLLSIGLLLVGVIQML